MPSASFNQRTLSGPIACNGLGLHSGASVNITLLPAPAAHGIVFVRTDLPTRTEIPAVARYVVNTELATTLGRDGSEIATVEHLLAAMSGLGIDNARIELDGPEVPIMDGSAAPFAYLIRSAGVRVLDAPSSFAAVKNPSSVR